MNKFVAAAFDAGVGVLDGQIEVERVIDETVAKVFTARAVVLSRKTYAAFAYGHDLGDRTLYIENPVPVLDFDTNVFGFACLAWEGDVLVATMTASFSHPTRLSIEIDRIHAEPEFKQRDGGDIVLHRLVLTTRKPIDTETSHFVVLSGPF